MSFDQFVVSGWLHSVRGPPSLDRGLAFFYDVPEQAQDWEEVYTREFPAAKAMSLNEIEQRRLPKTEGVTLYKCRLRGQEIQSNPSTSEPPRPSPSDLLRLWHDALASKRVLKTLNGVQHHWSIERWRGLENIILPQFDYDTENHKLLAAVVAHLLKESGPLIGKGRSSTPPGQCTLSLAIFCDGITPRGRPNVNIKAALVDLGPEVLGAAGVYPNRCHPPCFGVGRCECRTGAPGLHTQLFGGARHMFLVVNCTIFLFFFCQYAPRAILWVHQLSAGISPLAARKNARDLSGGHSEYRLGFIRARSGYRLGFIRWPLGKSLGIFPVAAQEIPKHIWYSLRCIRARS